MDRLDHRKQPIPFNVSFVTADRKRNSGGEIKSISGGILSKHNKSLPIHMRRVDGGGGSIKPASHENATRNIQDPSGSIVKMHIRLLISFNGLNVIW